MESNFKQLNDCVDVLIKNVQVFNTSTCQFTKKDVALRGHIFCLIEDRIDIKSKQTIDGQGYYMIPGFIDIHMHVESSMTYPQAFYQASLKWGTTTCVADPHEIANVYGLKGIQSFLENTKDLDMFFGIPSSVPSTNPHLETTGGKINLEDVQTLLKNQRMICLGEVMNFVDMKQENSKTNQMIDLCRKTRRDFLIEGHCPKLSGEELSYYLECGVDADHTQQTPSSIIEKTSKGMFIEMQGKSMTRENIDTIVGNNLYEMTALVTDDTMANQLIKGHLNENVKKAVRCGMPIEKAIYLSTYTPARRMHLNDRGVIAPGKKADFILLDNLEEVSIHAVYKNGQLVIGHEVQKPHFPKEYYHSILLNQLTEKDFQLPIVKAKKVKVNVMEINESSTFTKSVEMSLDVRDGMIEWQKAGLALIAVFERYGKNGNVSFGFVKGTMVKKAAVASTWAHDHHNLMVMGTDVNEMVNIANAVINANGGYGISLNGEVSLAVLDIAGIISSQPIEVLASQLDEVTLKMKDAGYQHMNPIMSFATLSLPVSPEIKITDVGLIDVKRQEILPLIIEEEN